MDACDANLTQAEFVDTICLDKNIILSNVCSEVINTNGVTLYVSQHLTDNNENDGLVAESASENFEMKEIKIDAATDVGNGKTDKTLYTMHFPSNVQQHSNFLALSDNDMLYAEKNIETSDTSLESEILDQPQDMDSLSPVTRLEDFMDVVTTYKCKFCRFSCPWKSGLMSHIRCCHINEKKSLVMIKPEKENNSVATTPSKEKKRSANISHLKAAVSPSNDTPKTKITTELDERNLSSEPESGEDTFSPREAPVERHIFLCGQCSEGFVSLDDCKQHMINDHNLKLESNSTVPVKKRGRPKSRPNIETVTQAVGSEMASDNCVLENKRQSKPPKNIKDYDLGVRKKSRRESNIERSFRCTRSGCGHRFSNEENLHYHYSSHSDIGKSFLCPECTEEFEQWRGLVMHLWKEHGIDIDLHVCSDCDYKTYSFFKLDNHRKIHSEERGFVCEQCGKGFKQVSQLRNHLVIHMDRKNLPHKRWYSEQECDTCGRKFSDTKCLRKHQQAVHSKLKPYVCSYCGHLSARKAMLELHMRQHTGEKPFLCEHCDYRTGDHNSLRRHRMRHTGTKPYKCPHCPYACIQAISYKTHLRNKHPGMDGLFSCTLCTFKSVSKENYINHMSDHKRETENVIHASNLPTPEIDDKFDAGSSDQGSVHMQLTDNALQQLEGILPSNITAAQLIYSCLNALSQDGGSVSLPPGVTVNIPSSSSTSSDGSQTITIQLPSNQNVETEPYYFTIQQQDGSTALLLPATDDKVTDDLGNVEFTKEESTSLDCGLQEEDDENGQLQACQSDLVIAHIEPFEDQNQLAEEAINDEENENNS